MTSFSGSPRLLKGGLVLADNLTGQIQRVIALQYNPDTLTRTLQVQSAGAESGDRVEQMRLKGPPIETIKLDAEIDAADQMERGNAQVGDVGIHPQLAALETIIYPSSSQLQANDRMAGQGMLEVAPLESPLVLFVWSKTRVVPVRLTEFSVTEEAFDPNLNPLRAKVSLGMRVLSVTDVGFSSKAGTVYIAYQKEKERLARLNTNSGLNILGIGGLP